MNEYQDWVFEEYGQSATDALMEEMDNPIKWFDTENGYFAELIGPQ